VSTSCIYAGMQTSMPLSDGFVDRFLIKTIPLQHNVLPKFLNVLDSCLVNAFLQEPPDFIIYGIEVWAVLAATDLERWSPVFLDWAGPQFLHRARLVLGWVTAFHALWAGAPSCWKMKNSENSHFWQQDATVDCGNTGQCGHWSLFLDQQREHWYDQAQICRLIPPDSLNVARVRSRRQDGMSFFKVPNGAYRWSFWAFGWRCNAEQLFISKPNKVTNDAG